jgi:hypothetical protein
MLWKEIPKIELISLDILLARLLEWLFSPTHTKMLFRLHANKNGLPKTLTNQEFTKITHSHSRSAQVE